MKLIVSLVAVATFAAAPAMAQGTFNNGRKPSGFGQPSSQPGMMGGYRPPSYGQQPSGGAPRPSYGAPSTMGQPTFKPYQGYKGSSVYSSKPPAAFGAKPCETSVYVNACDK